MIKSIDIIYLFFLLFLSGFFSGAEVALVSLSKLKVRKLVNKSVIGSKYVKKLKDNPQRMLSTILLGNNIVNVAAAALTTSIIIDVFGNYAVGIATGIITFLILIFGEIAPKSMASSYNETFALFVAAPIWYMSLVFRPILSVIEFLINIFPRSLGIKTQAKAMTQEDILNLVKLAEEEGAIKGSEEELITNILEFDDKMINEILTPRKKIVKLDSGSKVGDAVRLLTKSKHSRIPVSENDDFVGVVNTKDIFEHLSNPETPVRDILKQPFFVPETMKLSHLFRKFKENHTQIAFAVDEHGNVRGIVTLDDLLEEIVGDIPGEIPETEKITKVSENIWLVDGETEIDEVNKLGCNVKKEGFNTISGYMITKLDKIPAQGDELVTEHYSFKVKEMSGHRISTLLIEKK